MAGRLSLSEREEISRGVNAGESFTAIAARIRRAASTVSREVNRCGGRERYRAVAAHSQACERAKRPKPFKLASDPILAGWINGWMSDKYSPQTCAYLARHRGRPVSHETIYQAVYHPDRGLDPDRWKDLPRRRQRRKHAGHKWGIASGNPLGSPIGIEQRHPIAADRTQPGHLEGDLITGSHNRSAVLTIIERSSRYTWLKALPDGYSTTEVALALTELLTTIPPVMRRSLVWDQGREMKFWAEVQTETGTPIYFCDPHSPWQKPTVENNNGVLRRWLPKGTPLDIIPQTEYDHISELINHMPRPIHNWNTAHHTYHQHLVATTT